MFAHLHSRHPLVGALYAAFFAYEGGDAEKPSIAAGTMTQLLGPRLILGFGAGLFLNLGGRWMATVVVMIGLALVGS